MILIRVTIILMTVTAIPTIPITVSIITFCTFRVIFQVKEKIFERKVYHIMLYLNCL